MTSSAPGAKSATCTAHLVSLAPVQHAGAASGLPPSSHSRAAQDADVILLSSDSDPPLCRLLPLDKFKFEQGKADREQKKKQRENRWVSQSGRSCCLSVSHLSLARCPHSGPCLGRKAWAVQQHARWGSTGYAPSACSSH